MDVLPLLLQLRVGHQMLGAARSVIMRSSRQTLLSSAVPVYTAHSENVLGARSVSRRWSWRSLFEAQ